MTARGRSRTPQGCRRQVARSWGARRMRPAPAFCNDRPPLWVAQHPGDSSLPRRGLFARAARQKTLVLLCIILSFTMINPLIKGFCIVLKKDRQEGAKTVAWAAGHAEKGGGNPPQACASMPQRATRPARMAVQTAPAREKRPKIPPKRPIAPVFPAKRPPKTPAARPARDGHTDRHTGDAPPVRGRYGLLFPPQIDCSILSNSQEHPYFTAFFIV